MNVTFSFAINIYLIEYMCACVCQIEICLGIHLGCIRPIKHLALELLY